MDRILYNFFELILNNIILSSLGGVLNTHSNLFNIK